MSDPDAAIREAEEALLRCNSTKPTVLRAAVEALLPVVRAEVERAEQAEAALAEERRKREEAERKFNLMADPFFALAYELMPIGCADEARTNPASVLPYLEAWFERLKEAEERLAASKSAHPQPAPLEEAVKEALWRFGAVMLREFWDDGNPGDIDGGAAQEAAEEHGLWHQVERHADGVECEWCGNVGLCGELTEVGLAARAALAEEPK